MTRITSLLAVAMFFAGSFPAPADQPPQQTHDGLALIEASEIDLAYLRPEADFSGYEKVMLLEASVAFRKNWQRDHNSTSLRRVANRDVERMKSELAELLHEVFVEELRGYDGLALAEAPGDDVLIVRPAILDLDVVAPDIKRAQNVRSFAADAGAATLVLEVYDSVSGEILARLVDREVARNPGNVMRWANSVSNRAAAKRVLADWAVSLRKGLDDVRTPIGETAAAAGVE